MSRGHVGPGVLGCTASSGCAAGSWRESWSRGATGTLLILVVLLVACPTTGRLSSDGEIDEGAVVSPWGGVWITVTQELLDLSEQIVLPPQSGVSVPTGLQGRLDFEVVSPLPEWSIAVRFEPVCGACGIMEEGCMMVRGPATDGEFVSVCERPVIARGSGPAPATELWLELQARPEWTNPQGAYEGVLHLIPLAEDFMPVSEVPLPNGRPGFSGSRRTVPVTMSVDALTVVMTSESELSIETGVIPGRYDAVPDLDVVVATNEENWEVRLEGTPFIYGLQEIDLERLEWAELDSGGEPGPWTLVGEDNALMSSCEGCGVFSASYRMALEITESDRAGNYSSHISLVGAPW